MPMLRVIGTKYPAWLCEQRGWVRTDAGAELYIHPDEVWVSKTIKGVGRKAGPKGTT